MTELMPEPSLVLETLDDLRAALAHPEGWRDQPYPYDWHVKSVVLYDLIGQIEAEGNYPYNADVIVRAHALLGSPAISYAEASREGTPLSQLVYNAQQFRRSDKLRTGGYEPFTQEFLARAAAQKRKVEVNGTRCTPKQVAGRWYAFPPRARRKAYDAYGQGVARLAVED